MLRNLKYPILVTSLALAGCNSDSDPAEPVNTAPVISSSAALTASINTLYSYEVITSDADADEVTVSVTGLPTWLTYDAEAGALSGTPEAFNEGEEHTITILASDGEAEISQIFTITVAPLYEGYSLFWNDEFNGSAIDTSNWGFETGDGTEFGLPAGWGNSEQQIYTDATENVSVGMDGDDSALMITALSDGEGGYTSSKLTTQGKVSTRFGKIEARIKLPESQGIWPAFWMLGENKGDSSDPTKIEWPGCGEIDILELLGGVDSEGNNRDDETIHTVHYVDSENEWSFTEAHYKNAANFSEDYHVFTLDWTPESLTFSVDGNVVNAVAIDDDMKEFLRSFYLILNVAVGGNFPGDTDETTVFPQTMYVDYIRAYEQDDLNPDPAPALDQDEERLGKPPGEASAADAIAESFSEFGSADFSRWGAGGEPTWADSDVAVDGDSSVLFAYPGGNWGGGWIVLDSAVDLSAYAAGNLIFALHKPSVVHDIEIKLEGTASAGSVQLVDYTPVDLGDGWEEYSIPMADFDAEGLDLSSVTIPLALWNPVDDGGSFPQADILIDAIRVE